MFTLRLLGGAALEGDREAVTGRAGHPRRLALLALVASAPRGTSSREKLIAYLWPDSDTEQGRHLLKESLYVLRRALGGDALLSEGDNVRLDPERISSDLMEFEAALERGDLERAVRLYAGPFLDGFFLKGAPEFERWVETERRRLADAYGKALEALAEQAESASDYTVAAGWWKRLAAHDPYNSRVVLRLMQALAAAGDPANALEYARVHELRVREELGIEPPEDLRAYVERLRKEPVQASRAADVPTAVESKVTPTEGVARPTEGATGSRRLVHEIHRRSLWQALLVYCGGALIASEAVRALTEALGLPDWFPAFAIVLFIIGLPIVLATAFVRHMALPTVTPAAPTPLTEAEVARIDAEAAAVHLETRRRHRLLTWRSAAATFVIVLAAWGVVATGWLLLGPTERGTSVEVDERPSVAVLPLANRSGLEEDAYFTDGIHDEILAQLSKISGLSVRGRTSVMQYRDSPKNLRQVGEELNARYILEGSVLRAGGTVRINVQLLDARTDECVWAETYHRELSVEDLLAVQSGVALRVAEVLRASLTQEEHERIQTVPTGNLEAYENYLLGLQSLRSGTLQGKNQALRYLALALEADPTFAPSWAGLADTYSGFVRFHESPSRRAWESAAGVAGLRVTIRDPVTERAASVRVEMIRLATYAAERAVALDSTIGDGFRSLGRIHALHQFDHVGAEDAYLRAIELRPGDAVARADYAKLLTRLGRAEEGLTQAEQAVATEPLDRGIQSDEIYVRFHAGHRARALREIEELIREYPRDYNLLWRLAGYQVHVGRYAEAISTLRTQISMMGDNIADETALLGFLYGVTGRVDSAYAALEQLDQLQAKGVYTSAVIRSWPHIGLGNLDEAFEWLDRAVEDRDSWLTDLLTCPVFLPIRSDPRYLELLRQVGLSN